jgi:hypothetical protein
LQIAQAMWFWHIYMEVETKAQEKKHFNSKFMLCLFNTCSTTFRIGNKTTLHTNFRAHKIAYDDIGGDIAVGRRVKKETFSFEANGYVGLQLRKKYMVAKSLGLTGYL